MMRPAFARSLVLVAALAASLVASLAAGAAGARPPAAGDDLADLADLADLGADDDNDDNDDNDAPRVRLAQKDGPRGERGEGRGAGGDRAGRRAEIRERVQGKIQSYLTVELASRAGLDQSKSVQLGTAIKAQMERKQKAHQARKAQVQKLRDLLDSKSPDAAVKAQLKLVMDAGPQGDRQALLDDTARFLTATEQAKVMLALPEVMKDARRLVREARGERRRGGGGGGR